MEKQKDLPTPRPLTPERSDGGQAEKEITSKAEPKSSIFKSKFFLLFIAISLLIAFLIGGFMLGKNNVTKTQTPAVVKSTPIPTEETANWKTYTGNDFSLKYPSLLTVEEVENSYNQITGNKIKSTYISSKSKDINLYIYVEKNKNNLSEAEILDKYKKNIEQSNIPNDPSGKVVLDKIIRSFKNYKNGQINGAYALLGFDYDYDTVIDANQDNIYVFQYYGDQGQKISGAEEKTINQILSTFKFTNSAQPTQSFLEIPEYGVKFALSDAIKDAYYLPSTADKGYVYLKVHSLDSETQCAKDDSSTAALSRAGKDDINEMSGMKYSDSGNGVIIGNYYYYIDLAQYECAESVDGKATLVKVRKAFTDASTTIEKL